jgi:pyruvate kinase
VLRAKIICTLGPACDSVSVRRVRAPILAFAHHPVKTTDEMLASTIDSARRSGYIEEGDTVVFSAGLQERSPEAVVATARGTFLFC